MRSGAKVKVNGDHETEKKEILQFLFVLAEQSYICTTRAYTSHHRLRPRSCVPVCTFFSLLPQASLHCCGLMVSSPGPCASSGGRLPEALFMVFLLDSKGAKVCKSCRSRQELSIQTNIYSQNLASMQPRTSLFNFCNFNPALVI